MKIRDIDLFIATRRDVLVKFLTLGLLSVAVPRIVLGADGKPSLRKGRSFQDIKGKVFVNGKLANKRTVIGPNDSVASGSNSGAVFAVGKDAFLLRSNSQLSFQGKQKSGEVEKIDVVSGKVLSVFGKRGENEQPLNMQTAGWGLTVRGTGFYLENDPDASYLCTCYGMVEVASQSDPNSREIIESEYHDQPRYLVNDAPTGRKIESAPFKNHTDQELALIEGLLGRVPPFGIKPDIYKAPRQIDY